MSVYVRVLDHPTRSNVLPSCICIHDREGMLPCHQHAAVREPAFTCGHLNACRDGSACPQAVADLIVQCLDRNPAARPTVPEIVAMLGQPESRLPLSLLPRPASRPPAGVPVRHVADAFQTSCLRLLNSVWLLTALLQGGHGAGMRQ